MSDFITTFLSDLKTNIPGFIASSITETATGMSFGSLSLDPNFDVELAGSHNLEVVKAKQNIIKTLNLNEKIDDIMLTLTTQIHLISISENGNYFIYLAVDITKGNLGLTRSVLKKFTKNLEGKL